MVAGCEPARSASVPCEIPALEILREVAFTRNDGVSAALHRLGRRRRRIHNAVSTILDTLCKTDIGLCFDIDKGITLDRIALAARCMLADIGPVRILRWICP